MKIVLNGTFDIVHAGHLRMLKYASTLGDHVLVCIDSDSRVKNIKGADRPINSQQERQELLESLRAVDQVKIFNTDQELIDILKEYKADIMVKGSDWKEHGYIGQEYCKQTEWFGRIDGYSTTEKIQHIIARR
jgi:D-beta-D-heptose 7-phosphate kinase/D-beta-D-heptose 1-phosphate adenosyltransferase